jgi:NodT family efflux transporter outer membrane factor (OMF) lipoprotein
LQVQLTDTWFALRGLDQQTVLLQETETAYQRAAELIERRHRNGIASGLDLARANNQLQATRSQTQQVQAQRAVLEHAIAALVGSNASTFAIAAQAMTMHLPVIPAGIPSQLLQRRPDIAAARLRVAAAGAEVGAARTAFFPTLNLSASGGLQSSDLARLFEMSNLYWAIGPSLAMTMFDGGRRQARIANAQAVLDEAGQRYRSTVLGAFQQVEDQLALLERYSAAAASDQAAADAALRALELAGNRYRQGASSYLEVVTAQTASLQSRRSVLELHTRQQRASVQLVRALGGGWDSTQLPLPAAPPSE